MTTHAPILALDTSTQFLSIALFYQGEMFLSHQEVGNQQSALILPTIQQLLRDTNIQVSDLKQIVYAKGAGAFTGLRIGIGVAQGLATPFDIPLVGVPCLDAVAYQIPDFPYVFAATDARMGEVFYAFFDTKQHIRLGDYQVGSVNEIVIPENILEQNQLVNIKGIGNAFALSSPPPFSGQATMPTAADYLNLALSGRYPQTDAAHAELLYVRDKIALTAAEQTARKMSHSNGFSS